MPAPDLPPAMAAPTRTDGTNPTSGRGRSGMHTLDGEPGMAVGTRRSWLGAGAGLIVGGGATWLVLHQGGSTARCDQDANQDAWSRSQCWAASAAGGLVGAGIGALLAR